MNSLQVFCNTSKGCEEKLEGLGASENGLDRKNPLEQNYSGE